MAAIQIKNTYLLEGGVSQTDALSLERKGILISEAQFPNMAQNVARFYATMKVPTPNSAKISWRQIGILLRNSDDKIAIIIKDIDNNIRRTISIKKFNQSEFDLEPSASNACYYIIDRVVFDEFYPKSGIGLVALLGKNEENDIFLYLVRQDLSIPVGGGGPPYAGVKIPTG